MRPKTKKTKTKPRFTTKQIEHRLLAVLAPILEHHGGSAHTFHEWTLAGHGIVLKLANSQEFWLTVAESV